MRLDKFLKVSRILKRRAVAGEACKIGKVTVNGKLAKPAKQLCIGDEICLTLGSRTLTFTVASLNEKAGKEEAPSLYEIKREE